MTVSVWMNDGQAAPETRDIIVVGGGIAGHSVAYWLNRCDPNLKIVVLEKGNLGSGASGRNAGFITCGSVEHFNRLSQKHGAQEASAIWKFSETNLELLKEHIFDDSGTADFTQKGTYSLASTQEELSELRDSAQLMEKSGIRVETVDTQQIQQRLGAEGFVGGVKYLDDATVHPLKLLELIREKLASAPVEFCPGTEVYRQETIDGNKRVWTSAGCFEAPAVVMATNGYSALLDNFFADKIYPTRGQILCTAPVPQFMETACYAHFVLDYFRQLPNGQVLIGGFRQLQKDVELGYADQISPVIQSALEEFVRKHLPTAAAAPITHRWTGVMGFSFDGQPIVGALPSDPQTAFLGGFTAHGLGLAFHSGKVLAESLLEGSPIPHFLSARRCG